MKDEAVMLIAQLDKALNLAREMWMEAQEDKKAKCMARINDMLDQRLGLMALRDTHETSSPKPDTGNRQSQTHD